MFAYFRFRLVIWMTVLSYLTQPMLVHASVGDAATAAVADCNCGSSREPEDDHNSETCTEEAHNHKDKKKKKDKKDKDWGLTINGEPLSAKVLFAAAIVPIGAYLVAKYKDKRYERDEDREERRWKRGWTRERSERSERRIWGDEFLTRREDFGRGRSGRGAPAILPADGGNSRFSDLFEGRSYRNRSDGNVSGSTPRFR